MAYVAYALGALVVILVLAFVVLPLLQRRTVVAKADAITSPAVQRAEIYQELTELELDQRVGKISDTDYQEQSEALLARAAALIAAEDAEAAMVDRQVEREIAEARTALGTSAETEAQESRL